MPHLLLARWSMALAVNVMHGHGPSNKMCIHLKLKKTKVRKVVLAINMAGKALDALYTTNKTEHFSFRSGCVVLVAKCLKEDWFVVL